MPDTKCTALTENTAPISTDLLYMVDDPGGSPASRKATILNVIAGGLVGSQLVNEIKAWPPYVPIDSDLVTLNLWWDSVGTPSTAATVVDVAGEAGITETWELALKVVTDGNNEGFYQRYTFADEPRLKAGRACSALLAIWSVGGASITAKLVNQTAEETAAAAVTAAAWTVVEVPAHTLAGTYVDLQVTAGAAGTFYVVPLGLNIGSKAFALPPRPTHYVDAGLQALVAGTDPGGADFADLDCTAASSPLAFMGDFNASYYNANATNKVLYIKRNGQAGVLKELCRSQVTSIYVVGNALVPMDDGQVVEWKTDGAVANGEAVYINLAGYYEWA